MNARCIREHIAAGAKSQPAKRHHWPTVVTCVLLLWLAGAHAWGSEGRAASPASAKQPVIEFTPAPTQASSQAPSQVPSQTPSQTPSQVTTPQNACGGCHAEQVSQWQTSHHALSMQAATADSRLAEVASWPLKTEPAISQATFVFGIEPLQQYLLPTPGGRLQVLPFAWDARASTAGGQRWFRPHTGNPYPANDRLHWRQPLQNWNGMCADCHSTNLRRNYQAASNSFQTQADALNVSCQACHTLAPSHGRKTTLSSSAPIREWVRKSTATTASLINPQQHRHQQQVMETCAACHSLRTPLTSGVSASKPFADQFHLSNLEPNLYHADGQIKEEVYVWGSFLQSKMYAQGVSCNDCHNPHSLKLRAVGDALCAQCHSPGVFAARQHHGHSANSAGARCVNCHMPATTYMGVDDRRDHKFVIPRPQLTLDFGVPNACTSCHTKLGKPEQATPQWALAKLQQWHGPSHRLPANLKLSLQSGVGERLPPAAIQAVALDPTLPSITRASLLSQQSALWGQGPGALEPAFLQQLLSSTDPLLQLGALSTLTQLTPKDRAALATPLLTDSLLSVRIAAAGALLGVKLGDSAQSAFRRALVELKAAQAEVAWRGEGRMNRAQTEQRLGNFAGAVAEYQAAVAIDPYFAPAYVNLAEAYRAQQQPTAEAEVYAQALAAVPEDASVQHSYALYLVRQQRLSEALVASTAAVQLAPSNGQLALAHLLILDALGRTREGLLWLQSQWSNYAEPAELVNAGRSLAQKIQDRLLYSWFTQRLPSRK